MVLCGISTDLACVKIHRLADFKVDCIDQFPYLGNTALSYVKGKTLIITVPGALGFFAVYLRDRDSIINVHD